MKQLRVFKSKSYCSPLKFKVKLPKHNGTFRRIRSVVQAVVKAAINANRNALSTLAGMLERSPSMIDVFLNVIYRMLCWDLPTDLNKIDYLQRTVLFSFSQLQRFITDRVTRTQTFDSTLSSIYVSIHRRFTQPQFWKRMDLWLSHFLAQFLHLSALYRSSRNQNTDWISVSLQLDTVTRIFDVLFDQTLRDAALVPVTLHRMFEPASIPALLLGSSSLVPLLTRLWTTPISIASPPQAAPFLKGTIASLRMHLFSQMLCLKPSNLSWLPDSPKDRAAEQRRQVLQSMIAQVSSVIGGGRLGFVQHCLNRIMRLESTVLAKSSEEPINEIRGVLNLIVFASEADSEVERTFLAVDAVSVVMRLLDTILFTFSKSPSDSVSQCIYWALQYVLRSFNGGPTIICQALKCDLLPLVLDTKPHLDGTIEAVVRDILVGIELHLWSYPVLRRTRLVFDALNDGEEESEKKKPEAGYDGEWYELEELVTIRHMIQDDFIVSISQENPCYNESCQRHTRMSKPQKMRLKKCTGCLRFKVCSEECQRETWEAHKETCKSVKRDRSAHLFPVNTPASRKKELKFYRFAMRSFTSSFRARILLAAKVYRKTDDTRAKLAVVLDYTQLPATISVQPEENFAEVDNYAVCKRRTDGMDSMTVCGIFQHGRDRIRVLEPCSMKPML